MEILLAVQSRPTHRPSPCGLDSKSVHGLWTPWRKFLNWTGQAAFLFTLLVMGWNGLDNLCDESGRMNAGNCSNRCPLSGLFG